MVSDLRIVKKQFFIEKEGVRSEICFKKYSLEEMPVRNSKK